MMENLQMLNQHELITISGGHNGTAYGAGRTVGHAVRAVGEVFAFVGAVIWGVAMAAEGLD